MGEFDMNFIFSILLITGGMLVAMMIFLEIGRRIGVRRIAKNPEGIRNGVSTLEGAVFGLLGLLIAFTFSGALSRFDSKRQLIVEETNDIGTAYLRVDLLPGESQPAARALFRQYIDSRLQTYRLLPDLAAANKELGRSVKLQGEIWRQSVAASQLPDARLDAGRLFLPALNAMIDITTTRTMAMQVHPPRIIYILLFVLALASSLLAGYAMAEAKGRTWVHMLCFSLAMAAAIYVILDVEYPRYGFIRVDDFDKALIELRNGMN
jgi:hypothetical protein